jgi:hypothetical protein
MTASAVERNIVTAGAIVAYVYLGLLLLAPVWLVAVVIYELWSILRHD